MLGEPGFTIIIDKPSPAGHPGESLTGHLCPQPLQVHLSGKNRASSLHTALSMSLLCSEILSCLWIKSRLLRMAFKALHDPAQLLCHFPSFCPTGLPSGWCSCSSAPRLVLAGWTLDHCCRGSLVSASLPADLCPRHPCPLGSP